MPLGPQCFKNLDQCETQIDAFLEVYSGNLDLNDIFTMDSRCTQVFVVVAVITAI